MAFRLINYRTFIPIQCCIRHVNASKYFSSKTETNPFEKDVKKKKLSETKITLISPDESIQIVSYEEAEKISHRRDLKLVNIIDLDTKTQRPIYKLMTAKDYLTEELKQRESKKEKKNDLFSKGEKLLSINARISEHDLESRIKNILKWVQKKYEIRIVISGDATNMSHCDHIYHKIEENIRNEARIVQKRVKRNELKFQVIPPAKDEHATKSEKNL